MKRCTAILIVLLLVLSGCASDKTGADVIPRSIPGFLVLEIEATEDGKYARSWYFPDNDSEFQDQVYYVYIVAQQFRYESDAREWFSGESYRYPVEEIQVDNVTITIVHTEDRSGSPRDPFLLLREGRLGVYIAASKQFGITDPYEQALREALIEAMMECAKAVIKNL